MTAPVIERVKVGLQLATLPIWFLPVCLYAGYLFYGRDVLREIPAFCRLVFRGIRP